MCSISLHRNSTTYSTNFYQFMSAFLRHRFCSFAMINNGFIIFTTDIPSWKSLITVFLHWIFWWKMCILLLHTRLPAGNVKSRIIWSQVKRQNPETLVGFQAFEKTFRGLYMAWISLDSMGLYSPVVCQHISEARGRHGVAPSGYIK